jgi:hypothetical protein
MFILQMFILQKTVLHIAGTRYDCGACPIDYGVQWEQVRSVQVDGVRRLIAGGFLSWR